jgi:glycosyltransferase involved in cell wall biosynthesis
MQMPKISVIIPVYKVEEYIHRCVDSVLNQTYYNLEIILVDDGSPDNCGKICDQYAENDSRVIVVHKENGGLSDARNKGIDICTG